MTTGWGTVSFLAGICHFFSKWAICQITIRFIGLAINSKY